MYKNLNGLHHQHRARSYSCVNGVTQYRSRNLCGFVYHRSIRNHVDKYVITKHYLLMPLSLVTINVKCFPAFSVNLSLKRQGSYGFVITSLNTSSQSTTSWCRSVWR
ncbi:hypothetical protein T09_3972, partial [Trichinella sp. T9]